MVGAALCVFLIIRNYVGQEDNYYYWDFRAYWAMTQAGTVMLQESARAWLAGVIQSIWISPYNYAFTVPLMPATLVFGTDRLAYIEELGLLYMLPTMVYAWWQIRQTAITDWQDGAPPVALLGLWVLGFTPFWIPTLRGMPDIAGLPCVLAACRIFLSGRLATGSRPLDILKIVACLYLPILLRKWYCFTSVAVFCCGFFYSLHCLRQIQKPTWPGLLRLGGRFLGIAILVIALCVLLQGSFFLPALRPHYSDFYQAFQVNGWQHLNNANGYFGILVLLLAVVGGIAGLARPATMAPQVAFYCACCLVNVALFTHVQAFEPHHYLPIALFLLLLSGIGITFLLSALKERVPRYLLEAFIGIAATLSLFSTLNPATTTTWLDPLLPQRHFPPLQFPAGSHYPELVAELRARVEDSDKTFAVFASSPLLSQDLICNFGGTALCNHLVPAGEIDRRDGLLLKSLLTDYVLATNPAQFDHPAATQRVIQITDQNIVTGATIGAAYRPLASFPVGRGVQAILFEKVRPFRKSEFTAFMDQFFQAYPDWRGAYDPRLTELMTAENARAIVK